MFMIAGLLSLMAVGATAFFGFDFGPEDDDDAAVSLESMGTGADKTDLLDVVTDGVEGAEAVAATELDADETAAGLPVKGPRAKASMR